MTATATETAGERARRPVAAVGALLGAVLAIRATSPERLVLINWDQSANAASMALGQSGWSLTPWENHFAVGHYQQLAVWLVKEFGGTVIDGFRATKVVFLAGLGACFSLAALALSASAPLACVLTAVLLTRFEQLVLVATMDWNVDFLFPAAALFAIAARRSAGWHTRASIASGVCCAGLRLISFQAVPYAFTPIACALLAGPRRRLWPVRALQAGAVLATALGGLVAWSLLVAATSSRTSSELLRAQFRGPSPSILPASWPALGERLVDVRGALRNAGIGLRHLVEHDFQYEVPAWEASAETFGACGVAAIVALAAAGIVRGLRLSARAPASSRGPAVLILGLQLLVLTGLTLVVRERWEYAYMKRWNFVALTGLLLIAEPVGARVRAGRRRLAVALSAFALLVVVQCLLFVRFDDRWHAARPELWTYLDGPHPEAAWYGRGGRSWYGYFRGLRAANPGACQFVFALEELEAGIWNYDVIGALYSEIPDPIVIGEPARLAGWRFVPRVESADAIKKSRLDRECAWLSRDAARLLVAPSRAR